MVQAAVVAQGDASAVDDVAADPVVHLREAAGGGGAGACVPRFGWCGPVERAVWPAGVVDVDERVELGLQVGEGVGGVAGGQPAFEGLVEPFDFAAGLRVVGAGVDQADAEGGQVAGRWRSSATWPRPRKLAVKIAPLSVSTVAGSPQWVNASSKLSTTSAALNTRRACVAMARREWSSMMSRISMSVSSDRCQWVVSACQRWLGWSASNRISDDFGRFCVAG